VRISRLIFCILIILGTFTRAEAFSAITVIVNGRVLDMDVPPQVVESRTLVPFRAIMESLEAQVFWDGSAQAITVVHSSTVIQTAIDNKTAYVNGTAVPLDVAPKIYRGRTMIPLRFIAENIGAKVDWLSETGTVVITSGPGKTDAPPGEKHPFPQIKEQPNVSGNTPGNLSNGGVATIQGDWIYFSNFADWKRLYKMKTDGSGLTKLSDEPFVFGINAVGDWLYYYSLSYDDRRIRKMKIDGTEEIVLGEDKVRGLAVRGDWIYYVNLSDKVKHGSYEHGTLYKMKTDGTQKTKLSPLGAQNFLVDADWIYYDGIDNTGNNKLWRVKTDGTEHQLLFDRVPYTLNIAGQKMGPAGQN